MNRQLGGARPKQPAFGADKVAEMKKLEERPGLLIHLVRAQVDLQQLATVSEADEGGFAHLVNGVNPPGNTDVDGFCPKRFSALRAEGADDLGDRVGAREYVRVRLKAS